MAVIEAYITNLGKYNEGELASALLKFPTTREAVQEVLKQIGIDNIRYEEIFIADYDGDLSELNACLGEYESIDELNHLACLLSELDKSDLEKFEAVVASGEHTSGAGDLINLAENLDCYDFYIGVSDDETLGRIYAEDMEMIDIPENLRNYFDYEAYGRDMKSAEIATEHNYNMLDGVLNNQDPPPEQEKPLDKVKEPPRPYRSREREER